MLSKQTRNFLSLNTTKTSPAPPSSPTSSSSSSSSPTLLSISPSSSSVTLCESISVINFEPSTQPSSSKSLRKRKSTISELPQAPNGKK